VRVFERVGYKVLPGSADWDFGPEDREIQLQVLAGWADAIGELGDLPLTATEAWLTRRRDLITTGRSRMRVAHVDFFATPTAMR